MLFITLYGQVSKVAEMVIGKIKYEMSRFSGKVKKVVS